MNSSGLKVRSTSQLDKVVNDPYHYFTPAKEGNTLNTIGSNINYNSRQDTNASAGKLEPLKPQDNSLKSSAILSTIDYTSLKDLRQKNQN